jgi:acyl-CoA-dependent ceramide synthase
VGPYFAFFIFMWCYLRHYLNLRILYSMTNEFMTVGPYELNWETEQYKCWISHIITFALLASLQALNLFWLYYIMRIAFRYVFFQMAPQDDRSDNDESEFAEEQRLDAARAARDDADELAEDDDQQPPRALPNGQAAASGKTSSTDVPHTNGSTRRNKKKA